MAGRAGENGRTLLMSKSRKQLERAGGRPTAIAFIVASAAVIVALVVATFLFAPGGHDTMQVAGTTKFNSTHRG